jgi:hypothetical protein
VETESVNQERCVALVRIAAIYHAGAHMQQQYQDTKHVTQITDFLDHNAHGPMLQPLSIHAMLVKH